MVAECGTVTILFGILLFYTTALIKALNYSMNTVDTNSIGHIVKCPVAACSSGSYRESQEAVGEPSPHWSSETD